MSDRQFGMLIVAILALAALTACEGEGAAANRAARDYCRGALSVARTHAETLSIIERPSGWARIDGSACAEFIGEQLRIAKGDTTHGH